MLFIEAITQVKTQPSKKPPSNQSKVYTPIVHEDSVDLSSAAHQVKEIHLDSQSKTPLTASNSIFAHLVEHTLSYLSNTKLQLSSPEEFNLSEKDWKIFLQVPPSSISTNKKTAGYVTPKAYRPSAAQLIFHIPVKPSYGPDIEITLLLSAHQGSPETPRLFNNFPKENWIPALEMPYTPEFIHQQPTHHHIFLDQDGESDQLSTLYTQINQHNLNDEHKIPEDFFGLRIWQNKNNSFEPILLGDKKIGLLFVGHHKPLDNSSNQP